MTSCAFPAPETSGILFRLKGPGPDVLRECLDVVDIDIDGRRHCRRAAQNRKRHGDEVGPQCEIALRLHTADPDRARPSETAIDHVAGAVRDHPLLIGITERRVEADDVRRLIWRRADDGRLLEGAVGRESPRFERKRRAGKRQRAQVAQTAGGAEQIVVQHRAPAGLRADETPVRVAAEIERAALAIGIVDRDADLLRPLFVQIFQPRDIVEQDDVLRKPPRIDAQPQFLQFVARRADTVVAEQHEAPDHVGRDFVDEDFELEVFLLLARAQALGADRDAEHLTDLGQRTI